MTHSERQSHAQRSAQTREKIISAVVACIAEKGFKKTTTNAIAKQAGVTWGAIQHHFGGLEGCLIAAFDDSFQRFAATLGQPSPKDSNLKSRVATFIQRAWLHYGSHHYYSMFQLLLNDKSQLESPQWLDSRQQILQSMDDVWKLFFADVIPDKKQRRLLARYTHSVLTGLAVSHSQPWGKEEIPAELEILQKSVLDFIKA